MFKLKNALKFFAILSGLKCTFSTASYRPMTTDTTAKSAHYCSFCEKHEDEVMRLIAGPSVYICDECIALCQEMLKEAATNKQQLVSPSSPRLVYNFLDALVCGQQSAKQALAVVIYRHLLAGAVTTVSSMGKNNIIINGPTGSGKTFLIRSLAAFLDIPFAVVSATSYSQTGYVGDDVESMITRLIAAANGDVTAAERGIIFIDEIDKIAKAKRDATRDVSGEGVQQNLLAIIEGTTVFVARNIGEKRHEGNLIKVNTDNILFIGSGAFVGLEKIVEKRIKTTNALMTYDNSKSIEIDPRRRADQLCEQAIAEDFIKFGFIPEFTGRFTHYIRVNHLHAEDLIAILKSEKSSPITDFERYFSVFGMSIKFTERFYSDISHASIALGVGARGLSSVLMRVLTPYMFSAPDLKQVKSIIFDHAVLNGNPPIFLSKHGIPLLQKRNMVFIRCSHDDHIYLDSLLKVVKLLVRNDRLEIWSDQEIALSEKRRDEMYKAMATAGLAIFMISADFLASDYAQKELEYFMSVQESENVTVLWLLVNHCLYEDSALENFQVAHPVDRPLSAMTDHERIEVFAKIARLAKEVIGQASAGA